MSRLVKRLLLSAFVLACFAGVPGVATRGCDLRGEPAEALGDARRRRSPSTSPG